MARKPELSDAETLRLLRVSAEDWKARALREAAAGAHWRLLAAALLSRVPGRMAEFTVADVGALRAEGLSIDDFEAPDGTMVVRLHKAEEEAPPTKRGEPPTDLGPESSGTPCGTIVS